MDWQEYQEIIADMYATAEGIGRIYKNITRRDKVTGQPRQIDAWMEIETKGHVLNVLIDAKFRKAKVDVKDVEEVLALGEAVGADKCIMVVSNGWTNPAARKASASRMDMRLVTIEEAVEYVEPDKWKLCPVCENDCIIMDHDGAIELGGLWLWWLAGQCRECRSAIAWCQDCGEKVLIPAGDSWRCGCGHEWRADGNRMCLILAGTSEAISI